MVSLHQSDDLQSASNPAELPSTTAPPAIDYKQEVRFAVVMYGGVSLAIYINGIAQELFRMVRSTAPKEADVKIAPAKDDLSGTERVYRKLSYILADRKFREECQRLADANKKTPGFKLPDAPKDDAIETRFVVDILSGTSAGGINAIFLAKALANNQSIDQLKELWVNEGDIGLLINDKRSVKGLGLQNQRPPQSLLNSRRMYLKLLRALQDMDRSKTSDPKAKSRLLEDGELDLFITTTDIQGLALPIRLSDSVVFERRHRNVFRFKYRVEDSPQEAIQNDFVADNNPFLAFAARCTSSFPFAFEPMKLSDIDEVLDRFPEFRGNSDARAGSTSWRRFFDRDMLRTTSCLSDRPFGDGGYLDNKPFSFAAETIARRQTNLPVDRKLIYIEPSPEHPELEDLEINQVDALQNVKAAVLDLPTYETIREDLERVLERNNLINRVNQITEAIDQDLDASGLRRPNLDDDEWKTLDLAGMVQRFGIYYLPYRRLRIAAASDELARTVAKLLGLDEDSADYLAVRALVYAWRDNTYKDENAKRDHDRLGPLTKQITKATIGDGANIEKQKQVEGIVRSWLQINFSDAYANSDLSKSEVKEAAVTPAIRTQTVNQFLQDYDFQYWLRRLTFLRSKIDQLLQLDKVPFENEKFAATEKQWAVVRRLNTYISPSKYEELSTAEKADIKAVLNFVRCEVCELFQTLRREARRIQNPGKTPAFADKLKEIKLDPKLVNYLLGTVDRKGNPQPFHKLKPEEAVDRAKELFQENSQVAVNLEAQTLRSQFEEAANSLRDALAKILEPAWRRCELLMKTEDGFAVLKEAQDKTDPNEIRCPLPDRLTVHTKSLRAFLWHYLRKFDDYDQVRFPIMYGTDVGESDVVEVFRVSPEDAPSLINEREESQKPNGRQKLAGTALHHFGAFLDRVWRQNDIMWGRLDGAERLITAMLPYPDEKNENNVRDALIQEAHAIILREELSTESRTQLSMLMSEALIRASSGEPIEQAIEKVTKELTDASPPRTRLASAMTAIFDDDLVKSDDDKLVKFVKLGYRVNRKIDTKAVLETISRSTQTIGGIFEDLANKNGLDGKSLSWIARLGQFFWGLVQVAVPNSILNKLATHWLYLLYMFEIVMIIGGVVLARPGAQQFGWTALGITVVINALILLLHDLMRGRGSVKRALLVLGGILIGTLNLIGLLKVVGHLGLRVGNLKLTPLSWISHTYDIVLSYSGPFKRFIPYLLGLVVLATIVYLLNLAGVHDFTLLRLRPRRRKPEAFKPIELRRFKRRQMKNIQRCPTSEGNAYIIPVKLSAEPPSDWSKLFYDNWKQITPPIQVRIYGKTLRFVSELDQVSNIWNKLQGIINSTNVAHSETVKVANCELERQERVHEQTKDAENDNKWATLGGLR